jgi:type IV secretory pathway TrbF-like protein
MNDLNDNGPGTSGQADLFGDISTIAQTYIPDQRHVRNRLEDLVEQMRSATSWPWDPVMVRLHREKTFSYLCDLLADREEAAKWRSSIDAEITRLDAA